jgi:branched-chain amino acid transport system ATP-binding protein
MFDRSTRTARLAAGPGDGEQAPLSARGLSAGYHGVPAITDVDLDVPAGSVVALVGANGAGKSTTIAALAGYLKPQAGTIRCLGSDRQEAPHQRARRGLSLVADDRSILATLTVAENLRLGPGSTARGLELFPELEPLLHTRVQLLSGGEQQMLSLARALSSGPPLLLADELSLGLAPQIVQRLFAALRAAAAAGTGVLIVEQKVRLALSAVDHVHLMHHGRVVRSASSAEIGADIEDIERQYLGRTTGASATPGPTQES